VTSVVAKLYFGFLEMKWLELQPEKTHTERLRTSMGKQVGCAMIADSIRKT
jgi:hypothetical protein